MVEEVAALQPKAKSASLLWILIALVTLVLLLGVGLSIFLMSGKSEPSAKEKTEDNPKTEVLKPAIYFELERFVVNFSKPKRAKFLQVNVQILTREETAVDLVKHHSPRIRNNLIFLLSAQDEEDIKTAEGKEKLRQETLKEIQKILEKESGSPGVEDVFFTNFIMQ